MARLGGAAQGRQWRIAFAGLLLVIGVTALPRPVAAGQATPVIAIIIDDLGRHADLGRRAVGLPGPVACAFLPEAPHTPALAQAAHHRGKEVLVHLPMQSMSGYGAGPGALELDMTHRQFVRTLRADLTAVPHARGVNNHMGSLLTRHPGHMTWLMNELRRHGLFFIDSRTTAATVARRMARERGVANAERDVFLDNERTEAAVTAQLQRLVTTARRTGSALAIGHPYPETLAVLERELGRLSQNGVAVVSVGELVQRVASPHRRQARGEETGTRQR